MAEMDHLIRAAHTASPLIQHTGGVEQLQQVNPQAGPPPAAPCPPQPCAPPQPGAPVGPPIAIHEPAAGEHIVVPVVPNQPLTFDFNPLDLKAAEQAGDLILTFPDGAQITLHDIIGPCGPQPAPFELPDGTVITPSELLQAFQLSLAGPCGSPALINPTAGPNVANTGFGFPPFDVGGIGPGLNPEGPLSPTGFGITNEFVKGVGGGNSTPPGPPGPPTPPPPGEHLIVPDLDTHQYFLGTTAPIPPNGGGTVDLHGNYITEVVASSPAAFITDFWTPGSPPPAFGTHANPGGSLNGQFGSFTIDSAGNYDYQLSAASEHTLSQLGTDIMSQAVNQPFHTYQAGFQDVFDIATSNGFESAGTTPADIKQIQFDFYAANVAAAAASIPTVTPAPASATSMLLTYTDAVDPGHSFQQLVTVDTTGHVVVTPEGGSTIVQPNDPALVTLEYLSGSGANVSSVTIEGESFNIGATIGPGQHAYSAVINPALDTLGDNGDTGSASAAAASQDSGTGLTPLGTFNDTALSGISGTFGYLFDSGNTSANGAGRADAVNYADTSDAATLNGSTTAGATSVIEWSSTATIDGNTHIDGAPGSSAATGGINVLEIESATTQNLDFTSTLSSDPTTGNIKNVEVFDLTDGAHSSVANSITLTANDVFQLAEHEPTAIQNAGGAAALWILGGTNDTVNLAGTGSTWTQISAPVTQTGQAGGNASQMVGFTEFAATTTGGQAVHVYVQNAIQNAGHVAHA